MPCLYPVKLLGPETASGISKFSKGLLLTHTGQEQPPLTYWVLFTAFGKYDLEGLPIRTTCTQPYFSVQYPSTRVPVMASGAISLASWRLRLCEVLPLPLFMVY
jgi:hypothetical protein